MHYNVLIWLNLLWISPQIIASTSLDFKKIHHTQITIERGIYSLFVEKSQIWQVPAFGDFIIKTDYLRDEVSSEDAFQMKNRSTSFSKRVPIENQKTKSFYRGIFRSGKYLILLDPSLRRLHQLDTETMEWRLPRDLMFDTMSSQANERILEELKKYDPKKIWISDITELTAETRENNLLALSYFVDFPLILLSCNSRGLGACMFKKPCKIKGIEKKDAPNLVGLAYSRARKQIVIGNSRSRELSVFKFESCEEIKLITKISMPKELKELTSIDIDEDDNLWISTAEPDPYTNASVYRWNSSDW